ncbi:hypothetical protein ACFYZH_24665 [Streptomyces abikoensis]|uniref:hypothetical protein n=1 Tax=Streptomyces abikoensis TaxID=97398 RepID=UPI0036A47850
MNSSPIDPISIPHFTGNVDALVGDIAALAKDASDIRATGTDTHASFQGLSAHYEAPEAGQLLHSTLPVRERAAHFADELNKVKSALSEYAAEVRPIVLELDRLREQAVAFRASIGNDDKWLKNQSKTDENRHLIQAVTAAQERFHAAERNAFNKITGLFDKSLRLVEDDGTHKKGMYGYDPKAAAKAEKTPWGNVEKRKYEGVEWFWHEAVDGTTAFAKGFLIDGTWAQIRGLGTLVGVDGMEKSKEALKNMALLAFASNYVPGAEVARYLPDSWLPKVGRDYKKAANGTSKGLVAWDEWGKNPYRAFGTLTFNGLTLLTPVGEATAATKAGATAKAVTTAAKVVEVIDPATYAVKGARLGLKAAKPAILKVGDLATELKQSLGKLPDHTPAPAGESLKYAAADGKALLLDSKGNLHDLESAEHHPLAEPRKEPHKHDLTGTHELTDRRVLAHADGAQASGHAGVNGPWEGHHGDSHSALRPTHESAGHTSGPSTDYEPRGTPSGSATEPSHSGPGRGSPLHDSSTDWDSGSPEGRNPDSLEHDNGTDAPRDNKPLPELTPEERSTHWGHLEGVQGRSQDRFEQMQHDPDKGDITAASQDEARVGLDLREQGRLPTDLRRPSEKNRGDYYSPSTGQYYDLKGVHSDWPPFNFQKDKSIPFRGAYNPANNSKFVANLRKVIENNQILIIDIRNANQAAIDDLVQVVEKNGWTDRVMWYP